MEKFGLGPGLGDCAILKNLAEGQGDGNDSPSVYKVHIY